MFLRNDWFLIFALLGCSFLPLAFISPSSGKVYAEISVDGAVFHRLDLNADKEFAVETPRGKNLILIQHEKIFVTESDCPDKTCIHMGKIGAKGETVACLPHKLLIEIKER